MSTIARFLGGALLLAPAAASAQSTVYIPDVVELSGAGAVSGTNWRDGVTLAVEEINAKGGILGKKLNVPHIDTQSDAGIARVQVQKVIDNEVVSVLPASRGYGNILATVPGIQATGLNSGANPVMNFFTARGGRGKMAGALRIVTLRSAQATCHGIGSVALLLN